mgnify:CR=1 FL=1
MRGDLDGTLASFSWCLGRHDADPVRFPQKIGEGYDLLWQFKWVAEILLRHPRFPLAQVDAVVTDMETHYRRAGVGLSGVWQVRLANALATGHPQEAAAFRDEREAAGTDEYSHCPACVRSEDADLGKKVVHLISTSLSTVERISMFSLPKSTTVSEPSSRTVFCKFFFNNVPATTDYFISF